MTFEYYSTTTKKTSCIELISTGRTGRIVYLKNLIIGTH
jgi:hypothetical protein